MIKKLILIYNPVSGKAIFKNQLDEIIDKFQKLNCVIIPYRTSPENKGLADFIREINPDGLIAAGGDGTLHEVVNLVMNENLNLPIGIIGSGTSNDFATYLQLDTDDYFTRIAEGKTIDVDLGKTQNGKYFINVASAGMATSIAHQVNAKLKNAIGKFAYYLHGISTIPQFRTIDLHVKTTEDEFDIKAYLFLVVNSKTVASFKNIANKAELNDGKLDLLIVKECNMQSLVTLAAELMAGKDVVDQPGILYIQSDHFEISTDEVLSSDLDGELGPELPLILDIVPSAIKVYC